MYQTFKPKGTKRKGKSFKHLIIHHSRASCTHKKTRDFNFPSEAGMVPEMLLLYKSKLTRLFKLPSSVGIIP
jgi:hypothetical protein